MTQYSREGAEPRSNVARCPPIVTLNNVLTEREGVYRESHVAQSCYSVIGDKPFLWSKAKFDLP